MPTFRDRTDAGEQLAVRLVELLAGARDVVVLGLPRGGVPVAAPVARALSAPLDVYVVRKLGAPGQAELAIGAISSDGGRVLNDDVVARRRISAEMIEAVTATERAELERRVSAYRGQRAFPSLSGTVVLVDDGLATGATMRAAVDGVRRHHPSRLVVAAPVGAPESVAALQAVADDVVVPLCPAGFSSVGAWYGDFSPTTDDEVRILLETGAQTGHP